MGIIPDPVTPGLNCLTCFSAGETPSYLKVFFSGIQRGNTWYEALGMPPNGYYDLQQNPSYPCFYYDTVAGWPQCHFRMYAAQSQLFFKPGPFHTCFTKTYNTKCIFEFENFYQGASGNDFYSGWGHVLVPEQLASIVELVTPLADPDPRLENFPVSDSQTVVRYAGKRDATNINILFDTPYPPA